MSRTASSRKQGISGLLDSPDSHNGSMRFRSHVMRPLDLGNRWNLVILGLTGLAFVVGVALTVTLDRPPTFPLVAAGAVFLSWALARELDPDHQSGAVLAAIVGGVWAVSGMPTAILPFVGLLMVARLLVETTGRRPLVTDLAGLAILAGLISITSLGWVVGFGLAVAIYFDDRMATTPSRQALLASIGAAVAATLVVKITDALPTAASASLSPTLIIATGCIAIVGMARAPISPVSFADSRDRAFIRSDRLHAGRAVVGALLFVGALLDSDGGRAVVPMAFALVVSLVSEELERLRRARLDRR